MNFSVHRPCEPAMIPIRINRMLRKVVGVVAIAVCIALVPSVIVEGKGQEQSMPIRRVIVDVDAGADDAWALYYLLMTPRVRVEAISCVKGNTNVENVGRNVLRILTAMGLENKIPVYLGSNESLITPTPKADPGILYYGSDGFADIEFTTSPELNTALLHKFAIQNMNSLIDRYPNELTLIALGPLTNIALLLKLFPESRRKLKDIFIMGGNRHGVGNTESAAEYNFYSDPEGANIVINSLSQTITLFPWETASKAELTFDRKWRFEELGAHNNAVLQILNAVEKKALGETDPWLPCDLLVPMVFSNPEIITDYELYRGDVELYGHLTRGMLVLDHQNKGIGNIRVIDGVNRALVEKILLDLVSRSL